MSRKRNFALPNALRAPKMVVHISRELYNGDIDAKYFTNLRFTGSMTLFPAVTDFYERHTESHLLLFEEKVKGAPSSTRSDQLRLLQKEIKELKEDIDYVFIHDGTPDEATLSKDEIHDRYPRVMDRIKEIVNSRKDIVKTLKKTPAKDLFNSLSIQMRVTAKELTLLSLILMDNDWLELKSLSSGKLAHQKLNRLLSHVHVIDQKAGNRPRFGSSYTYSNRSVDTYEKFKTDILSDFSQDPIGSALEESAIDYVDNATKEITHGLGLK
jgi:hypothetical protein